MSDYIYSLTDMPNDRVNVETITRAILNAGLASGGALEGLRVLDGAISESLHGVIEDAGTSATLIVSWQDPLSGSDETDQDVIVSNHPGDGFDVVSPISAASPGLSTTGANMVKLALQPSGPLAEGVYEVAAEAEIRVQGVVGGSHAKGSVQVDSSEIIQHNNPNDVFEAFGIVTAISFEAGATPLLEITLENVGNPNTAEIQQATLSLQRIG